MKILPIFAFLLSKCAIFGCISKFNCNFATEKDKKMAQMDASLDQLLQSVEQNGVCVRKEMRGGLRIGVDEVFPYIIIVMCVRGSARVMYDMQELTIEKNDFGILLPGHVLRRITYSEDYTYSCVLVSAKMYSELRSHIFSHDYGKYASTPKCHLTDIQAMRMMVLN